ncbi:MAG: hypothetical protein ABEI27_03740 [Halobellus sp.]|uniref:hypothetical protein n=1 Tax=Halobellus sp. TaxID=1979212 RepID=UPI0035D511A9
MEIIGLTAGAFILAVVIGLSVAGPLTTSVIQLSEAAIATSNGDLDPTSTNTWT